MFFSVVSSYSGHSVGCDTFAEAIALADRMHCKGAERVIIFARFQPFADIMATTEVVVLRGRTDRRA